MSLKQEIENWVEALKYYDDQNYDKALEIFEKNADTSKLWFNVGMIYATLGEHERAIEAYKKATKLDQFLAVAYFQQGVSNFLLLDYDAALSNFNEALLYLRGNNQIDYEQLGLKFRLYSCEVLFNRGLCYIYSGQEEEGMNDLNYASKEQLIEDHKVIDEAIAEGAIEYTVFSIPVGTVYRPNEAKVRNVKQKDYLGKARLVAATDRANAFTGFAGAEVKKAIESVNSPTDDRQNTQISFAASNLVRNDLINKTDQNQVGAFPPTPPPEKDIPSRNLKQAPSVASRSASQRVAPSARQERAERDLGRSESTADRQRDVPRRNASTVDRRTERDYAPPPRRAASTTSNSTRSRGARDPPPQRRRQAPIEEYSDDDYDDDELYDLYRDDRSRRAPSVAGSRRGSSRQQTRRREYDDDRYASDAYEGSSLDEGEFEMLDSRSRTSSRRQPDIKKIKVKCHNGDDTRIIMITPSQDYREFMKRLKDKFGFRKDVKCKIKDEDGEMISLFDQEDLENAISTVKAAARKEKLDTGKMEVWVME